MSTIVHEVVDASREGSPDHPLVTAVLAARDGHLPWLQATFDALLAQTLRPERLVVVDGTRDGGLHQIIAAEFGALTLFDVTVVRAKHDEAFAALVDRALLPQPVRSGDQERVRRARRRARPRQTSPGDRHSWVWLLHEDSAPAPGALAALMSTVQHDDRLGVLGCKITELDRPDRLVNVGLDVTRAGRSVPRTHSGELDQGQHDGRHDVLAVASSGMLVRRDVYLVLGGFDPAFDGDGDGLDLCWRARLAGHGVAVVPDAVAHQDLDAAFLLRAMEAQGTRLTRRGRRALTRRTGDPDRPAPQSASTLRRHRQVALARTSGLRLVGSMLWTLISSSLLGLALLLVKRPRRAGAEFAQASAPFGIGHIFGARRRFRGRSSVRDHQLDSVFVPAALGRAAAWDAVVEALTPAGSSVQAASTPSGSTSLETGPVSDEADEQHAGRGVIARVLRLPGLWAVLAMFVAGLVVLRRPLSHGILGPGDGLAGGALQPYFTSPTAVWHTWRDAWQGAGYGHAFASAPYLPFIAIGAWLISVVPGVQDAQAAQTALVVLWVTAPALAGWAAYLAARVVTHRPWPRAAAALAWGTSAPLLTALADGRLGALVAAIVLPLALAGAAGMARPQAGVTWCAATSLALTVLVAFAPVMLVVALVGMFLVAVLGSRGSASRALAVSVAVVIMLGHWIIEVVRDPSRLLTGPGNVTTAPASDVLATVLQHPGGPGSSTIWLGLTSLAAGLFGAVHGRRHARMRWVLVLAALASFAAALAASRTQIGLDSGTHVWSGLPLLLCTAALLALGLLGAARDAEKTAPHTARARTAVLAGVAASAVMFGLGGWASLRAGESLAVRASSDPVPAIAAQDTMSARAGMVLELTPGVGSLTYDVRSREAGLPAIDVGMTPMQTPQTVAAAVAALADPAGDHTSTAQVLRDAGISYITVHTGADPIDLSTFDGITPMASSGTFALYHVDGDGEERAARVVISDGSERAIVPVSGDHARVDTAVRPGSASRTLSIAAGSGFANNADVTLDGHRLARVPAATPTYHLGASGGHLVITARDAWSPWRYLQLLVGVLVVFLALPFGSSRNRERA